MSFSTLDYAMQRRPSTAPAPTTFGINDFSNCYIPEPPSTAGIDDSYFAFNVPDTNTLTPAQAELFGQWSNMRHQDSGYFSGHASTIGTPAYETEIPHLSSAASTTSTTHSGSDSPRTPKAQELPPSPPLPATRKDGKISRPPNAWILYRSDKLAEVKEARATVKTPQAELSKMIAERWRAETAEVKRKYDLQAQLKKQEHDALYPGYKFKPRKKGEKAKEAANASPKTRTGGADRTPRIRNRAQTARPQTAPGNRATRSSARNAPTNEQGMTVDGEEGDALFPSPMEEAKTIPEVKAQLNAIWNSNEEQQAQQDRYTSEQPFHFQAEPQSILFPDFPQPSTSYQFPTLTQPTLPDQPWLESTSTEASLSSPAWTIPTVFGGDFSIPFNTPSSTLLSPYNELDTFPVQSSMQPSYPTPAELEMISPFVPPSPNYQFPTRSPQQQERPDWWEYRHVRVKRAESGVELQELLQQLSRNAQEMEL